MRLLKLNELGIDVLDELSDLCRFENEFEMKRFMELLMNWYNNSPQYVLGGYSPSEFGKLCED